MPGAPAPGAEGEGEVHVCVSSTCRSRGSEAALAEIEELAAGAPCSVSASGCLGYCRRGPAAAVVLPAGDEDPSDPNPPRATVVFTRLNQLEDSKAVVERATGRRLDLGPVGGRFAGLRAARARKHARKERKWNRALHGLAEEASARPALAAELHELLGLAGFPGGVPAGCFLPGFPALPAQVEGYSVWKVESVTPVSTHSAVWSLTCSDRRRGTPHPRGRGRVASPNTWHTTLLAPVGANGEGPLPWVERDYTPVSTGKDWEAGRVDILAKVYPDGLATSWLARAAPVGSTLRLSKPVPTLAVPQLVPPDDGEQFQPASVLLLLAGTGAVALPQILAHRDPTRKLGIPTARRQQLRVPIEAILSFRADDALLLGETAAWCREHVASGEDWAVGLRRCTLLLTEENRGPDQFAGASGGDAAAAEVAFAGLANAEVRRGQRLRAADVSAAVWRLPKPCRAVVSGPGEFNQAARSMLAAVLDEDNITVLAA